MTTDKMIGIRSVLFLAAAMMVFSCSSKTGKFFRNGNIANQQAVEPNDENQNPNETCDTGDKGLCQEGAPPEPITGTNLTFERARPRCTTQPTSILNDEYTVNCVAVEIVNGLETVPLTKSPNLVLTWEKPSAANNDDFTVLNCSTSALQLTQSCVVSVPMTTSSTVTIEFPLQLTELNVPSNGGKDIPAAAVIRTRLESDFVTLPFAIKPIGLVSEIPALTSVSLAPSSGTAFQLSGPSESESDRAWVYGSNRTQPMEFSLSEDSQIAKCGGRLYLTARSRLFVLENGNFKHVAGSVNQANINSISTDPLRTYWDSIESLTCRNNSIFISAYGPTRNVIYELSPDGKMSIFANENKNESVAWEAPSKRENMRLEYPRSLVFDSKGSLYFLENLKIRRIDPSGDVHTLFNGEYECVDHNPQSTALRRPAFNSPISLALDEDQNGQVNGYFVADNGYRKILRVDAATAARSYQLAVSLENAAKRDSAAFDTTAAGIAVLAATEAQGLADYLASETAGPLQRKNDAEAAETEASTALGVATAAATAAADAAESNSDPELQEGLDAAAASTAASAAAAQAEFDLLFAAAEAARGEYTLAAKAAEEAALVAANAKATADALLADSPQAVALQAAKAKALTDNDNFRNDPVQCASGVFAGNEQTPSLTEQRDGQKASEIALRTPEYIKTSFNAKNERVLLVSESSFGAFVDDVSIQVPGEILSIALSGSENKTVSRLYSPSAVTLKANKTTIEAGALRLSPGLGQMILVSDGYLLRASFATAAERTNKDGSVSPLNVSTNLVAVPFAGTTAPEWFAGRLAKNDITTPALVPKDPKKVQIGNTVTAFGTDGSLYVMDNGTHLLYRVGADDLISPVLGPEVGGIRPALVFNDRVNSMVFSQNKLIYIEETIDSNRIRSLDLSSGALATVAYRGARPEVAPAAGTSAPQGANCNLYGGTEILPRDLFGNELACDPRIVTVDKTGLIVFFDIGARSIRRLEANGTFTTIAGSQPSDPIPANLELSLTAGLVGRSAGSSQLANPSVDPVTSAVSLGLGLSYVTALFYNHDDLYFVEAGGLEGTGSVFEPMVGRIVNGTVTTIIGGGTVLPEQVEVNSTIDASLLKLQQPKFGTMFADGNFLMADNEIVFAVRPSVSSDGQPTYLISRLFGKQKGASCGVGTFDRAALAAASNEGTADAAKVPTLSNALGRFCSGNILNLSASNNCSLSNNGNNKLQIAIAQSYGGSSSSIGSGSVLKLELACKAIGSGLVGTGAN